MPYSSPRPVTSDDWTPPALAPGHDSEHRAAQEAERGKTEFHGTINGFRFYADDDPVAYSRLPCDATMIYGAPDGTGLPFDITYLPPATSETYAPYVVLCPGGGIARAARFFGVKDAEFAINYFGGKPVIDSISSIDRIEKATVRGNAAVVVKPLTDDGYGPSVIGFVVGRGFFEVSAREMPLSELTRIAEGVVCKSC